MTWRYRLYGLQVDADFNLGALPPGDAALPADAAIAMGPVPKPEGPEGGWIERRGDQLIIDLAPSGRFLVDGGRRITVDDAQAGAAALRWRLLGIAFGALLHQRSVLPLHSTVIAIGGRNIGLVGRSGAGKSTLAAFLQQRGHPVLIDDVCAVVTGTPGRVVVEAGNGFLRLWDDAMAALDRDGGERLDPAISKFEHSCPASDARVELHALVEISDHDVLDISALDLAERMSCALRHSYCREIMLILDGKAANFRQCAAVAGALPMYQLARPRGFDRIGEVVLALEGMAAELG